MCVRMLSSCTFCAIAARNLASQVLGVFLCRWHSVCLGRREAKVAAERAARRSAWRRRRRSTAQALEAPAGWWLAGFLAFAPRNGHSGGGCWPCFAFFHLSFFGGVGGWGAGGIMYCLDIRSLGGRSRVSV